ncbi:MAG: hypothetical protein AAF589_02390 [Planctomycetota bacterium]
MASQRTKQLPKAPAPKERPPKPAGWSFWVRVAVSVVVLWHMAVVFLSPLSVPPTSTLVGSIAQSPYMRWYSDPLYLNHGYHFFGPDPPMGGQLIRYQVFGESGQVIEQGEFPSLKEQWPRLWYHRHMMLADQTSIVAVYGDPDRDKQLMLQAYARHLLRKHGGVEARVENLFHESLWPDDVLSDADPYDPRYYASLMTVVQRAADLNTPLLPPAPTSTPVAEEVQIGVGE